MEKIFVLTIEEQDGLYLELYRSRENAVKYVLDDLHDRYHFDTDEPYISESELQEKRNVVLEEIDLAEHLLQELPDSVAGEDFIDAGGVVASHDSSLRLWVAAVVDAFDALFLRDRQDGHSGFQRVDIFRKEIELP